jgi:hypothetical protein
MNRIGLLFALALVMASGCAREPEQLVLAPTSTPQGAIVPTRQPTQTFTITPEPSVTSTDAPVPTNTVPPTETSTNTPQPTSTPTATLSATVTPEPTNTMEPSATPEPSATVTTEATGTPVLDTFAGTGVPAGSSLYSASYISAVGEGLIGNGRIGAGSPLMYFAFPATGGAAYDIVMTAGDSRSITLRPMLHVFDPDGAEVARTSIYNTEFSAAVRGFVPPRDGVYTIAATRVGGEFGLTEGEFTLEVLAGQIGASEGIPAQTLALNQVLSGAISDEVPEQLYVFFAEGGTRISAVMDAAGTLDSRILLYDNLGRLIGWNDDDFDQPPGNVDARMNDFVLPRAGFYSLLATRFFENAPTLSTGSYRLKVDNLGVLPADAVIYEAVIDTANTTLVTALNQTYSGFLIGEFQPPSQDTPVRIDALITFALPPVAPDAWSSAAFSLAPCRESEGGFGGLGELNVLDEAFGVLAAANRDLSRVTSGARVVARVTDCSPVDFTDIVRAAYETDADRVQIRLTFRNPQVNATADSISITPRLVLSP